MLTKEELKEKNQLFWMRFRKFMYNLNSANGRKMNWLNYPTDAKHIFIRLEADSKGARLCFDIQPKNDGIRSIIWEQMTELKKVMESCMNDETIWLENLELADGRIISRILWSNENLNFHEEKDEQAIFEYFKIRLLEFDVFYQEYKEILISLTR